MWSVLWPFYARLLILVVVGLVIFWVGVRYAIKLLRRPRPEEEKEEEAR